MFVICETGDLFVEHGKFLSSTNVPVKKGNGVLRDELRIARLFHAGRRVSRGGFSFKPSFIVLVPSSGPSFMIACAMRLM